MPTETAAAAVAALDIISAEPWGTQPGYRRALAAALTLCLVFAYPPENRRLFCTTTAIESPHMQLRNIIKARRHPTDETATKLLYLALRNILSNCKREDSFVESGDALARPCCSPATSPITIRHVAFCAEPSSLMSLRGVFAGRQLHLALSRGHGMMVAC